MVPNLKIWWEYFLQLARSMFKKFFSKLLPRSIVHDTPSVQPPIYGLSASNNFIEHQPPFCRQRHYSSERHRSTGKSKISNQHVVEEPIRLRSRAENLRRRKEVVQRLLEIDHICNGFMSFTVSTGDNSSELQDEEESLVQCQPYHTPPSKEESDSSIFMGILSCEISKVLQSVIQSIENTEKAPQSLMVADEPYAVSTDNETTSDWGLDAFPVTRGKAESSKRITTELSSINVRGSHNQDDADESSPEVTKSIEPFLQNAAELYEIQTIQRPTECSNLDVADEQTDDSKTIQIESSETLLENDTDSLPRIIENDDPFLHSDLAESSRKLTEISEQSVDEATKIPSSAEDSKSTTEPHFGTSHVQDISPSLQSSSRITFKKINNKFVYMPKVVAGNFGMKESASNWDVNWTHDFVSFRTCRKMKRHQRINHFPGSICLSNKDLLGRNLNLMYECFPNDYDIFPRTWFIPGDMAKIRRYIRNNNRASFIVKPHDGGAGSGIKITSRLQEMNYSRNKIVCQLYIQRPFLIDGYKFDFRVYVLMTSIEPLRIFVHKEGLARFATIKYEKPSASNSSKKFMHLTNTCVNKNNPDYVRDESNGSTRRITKVFQWFTDNSIDGGKVQDSMDDVIIKTIIVCLPTLQHYYRLSFPDHTATISCFELMGFDIMLDHKLKVYLLEVNIAPSFANETRTLHVASIKQEVVSDTFKILNLMETERDLKQKTEKRVKKGNKFKDKLITNRRIQWENSHMGNFRKIYPPGGKKERYYQKFINEATSRLKPSCYFNNKEIDLTAEQRKWLT